MYNEKDEEAAEGRNDEIPCREAQLDQRAHAIETVVGLRRSTAPRRECSMTDSESSGRFGVFRGCGRWL